MASFGLNNPDIERAIACTASVDQTQRPAFLAASLALCCRFREGSSYPAVNFVISASAQFVCELGCRSKPPELRPATTKAEASDSLACPLNTAS